MMNLLFQFLMTFCLQVTISLACFVVLYLMSMIPTVLFADDHGPGSWRELLAYFITVPLTVYLSLRIGFHFGHRPKLIPSGWFAALVRIAMSLTILWFLIRLGMFDFLEHLLGPLSADYVPGDLPELSRSGWLVAIFLQLIVIAMIALVGVVAIRECTSLKSAHPSSEPSTPAPDLR